MKQQQRILAHNKAHGIGVMLFLNADGTGFIRVGDADWSKDSEEPYWVQDEWTRYCTLYPKWWKFWTPRPVHEAVAMGLARYAALLQDADMAKRVSDEMGKVADEIVQTVREAQA